MTAVSFWKFSMQTIKKYGEDSRMGMSSQNSKGGHFGRFSQEEQGGGVESEYLRI